MLYNHSTLEKEQSWNYYHKCAEPLKISIKFNVMHYLNTSNVWVPLGISCSVWALSYWQLIVWILWIFHWGLCVSLLMLTWIYRNWSPPRCLKLFVIFLQLFLSHFFLGACHCHWGYQLSLRHFLSGKVHVDIPSAWMAALKISQQDPPLLLSVVLILQLNSLSMLYLQWHFHNAYKQFLIT